MARDIFKVKKVKDKLLRTSVSSAVSTGVGTAVAVAVVAGEFPIIS